MITFVIKVQALKSPWRANPVWEAKSIRACERADTYYSRAKKRDIFEPSIYLPIEDVILEFQVRGYCL